MKNMKFTMQFRGVGFSKKIADKNSQFDEPPRQRITTEVSGPGKEQFIKTKVESKLVVSKNYLLNRTWIYWYRKNSGRMRDCTSQ
jgi:hypothetical protein